MEVHPLQGLTHFNLDPESIPVEGKGIFIVLSIRHRQHFLSKMTTPRSLRLLRTRLTTCTSYLYWSKADLAKRSQVFFITACKAGALFCKSFLILYLSPRFFKSEIF
jgi:hypothetical protein